MAPEQKMVHPSAQKSLQRLFMAQERKATKKKRKKPYLKSQRILIKLEKMVLGNSYWEYPFISLVYIDLVENDDLTNLNKILVV